jgi:hypothetical protein
MTTPFEQADDLDFLVLGYDPSPGLLTLSGHDRVKNWDIQSAKGTTGASTKLNGDPIGRFKARFYLAHDNFNSTGINDFELWEDFQRKLEGLVNGPTPSAVPVYHPDLARNKFTEVTVASIGGMLHDGKGGATVEVEFIEYKPPKPKPAAGAKAKPGASGGGGTGKPAKPDPNAAAKAELAALVAEAKKP